MPIENANVVAKPIRILVLADDKPGHFNQSKGVVAALSRHRSIEMDWQDIKLPANRLTSSISGFRRFLSHSIKPKPRLIELVAGAKVPVEKPDLIVSAGGATLPANIFLARHFDVPNIFCGTIRKIPADAFQAILVPYKQFENTPPYIVALKPCNIDPDKTFPARSKSSILFLLGGDCKTHHYTKQDWDTLLKIITEACESSTSTFDNVVVCNSRRTDDYVSDQLIALSKRLPSLIYHDYRKTGAFNIEEELIQASFVVVSEDSNSMITEAVCSQSPLCVYQPESRNLSGLEESYIRNLETDGRLARIALDHNSTFSELKNRAHDLNVLAENHFDILATKILAGIDL